MKFLFLYNFIINKSTGYYTGCAVNYKKKEDELPTDVIQQCFLDPENNFDLRLALWVAKELRGFEIKKDENIRRIWIDIRTMNFFILVCCDNQDEMMKIGEIGLSLLKKYACMSPNKNLSCLSEKIKPINEKPELNIDDDYLGFFSGKEKHGYIFNFVE